MENYDQSIASATATLLAGAMTLAENPNLEKGMDALRDLFKGALEEMEKKNLPLQVSGVDTVKVRIGIMQNLLFLDELEKFVKHLMKTDALPAPEALVDALAMGMKMRMIKAEDNHGR